MVKAEIKADVFNLKGWIISKEDLKGIGEKVYSYLKKKSESQLILAINR